MDNLGTAYLIGGFHFFPLFSPHPLLSYLILPKGVRFDMLNLKFLNSSFKLQNPTKSHQKMHLESTVAQICRQFWGQTLFCTVQYTYNMHSGIYSYSNVQTLLGLNDFSYCTMYMHYTSIEFSVAQICKQFRG